jgi:hypothetical protein
MPKGKPLSKEEQEKIDKEIVEEKVKAVEEFIDNVEIVKVPKKPRTPFSNLPEEEKAKLKETWNKEDVKEQKEALLTRLEEQVEESGAQDEQAKVILNQIFELKARLESWSAILANPSLEGILSTYFNVIRAMPKMCSKTIITVEEKDGNMVFSYEFFKDGKRIVTEHNDIYGESEE